MPPGTKPALIGRPFKPGQSGNPAGRPKLPPGLREQARAASPAALKRAIELIDDEDPNVALKAINTVLDRAYGKPSQPVDGDGEGGPIRHSIGVKFINARPNRDRTA